MTHRPPQAARDPAVNTPTGPRPEALDEFHERIYLEELLRRCRWAHAAVTRVNELLKAGKAQSPDFLREVLDFVNQCATVSRLLWPPHARSSAELDRRLHARGEHLREVLGIEPDRKLAAKSIRNHLAHYEVQLDKWIRTLESEGSKPTGATERGSGDVDRYDTASRTVHHRGEAYDIQGLYLDAVDVLRRVEARLAWLSAAGRARPAWAVPERHAAATRNVSCPCGSGLRYKRCCGAVAV